jgi:2-dehydro-3-deoxyphosphogluconate aldolase / (4S)-4-hydroxy-2-oxoglutarate aldolase
LGFDNSNLSFMARFTRLQVYNALQAAPIVPLFTSSNLSDCQEVMRACYRAGIRLFEITNRGEFAHEIFAALVRTARQDCPDMILGGGTIMDAGTAALYIQLGADFIVAPNFNPEIAKVCNRRKIAYMPGCATISEVSAAEEWGVEVVKLFPGDSLSPGFIKALKGPLPWSTVLVTGGVELTEASLGAWFGAGASAVGVGSNLVTKDILATKNWEAIEASVKNALAIVAKIRG